MRHLFRLSLVRTALSLAVLCLIHLGDAPPLIGQEAGGGSCSTANLRTDIRPNPEGEPTEVSVALFLVDLTDIDDVAQLLSLDLITLASWTDPRLTALEGCQLPLSSVWHPQLDFLNSGHMETRSSSSAEQVDVGPGGLVSHQQRFYGSLASYHSLRDFPLDDQEFKVSILSPEYGEDEVMLVVNERQTGRRDQLNITDWNIGAVTAGLGTYTTETIGRRISVFEYRISAGRQVGFYIWKVIIPLILIVAMSWAVFWVSPSQFTPQIGLSATAMLTLIAFQFALVGVLPRLAYFTILDRFIVGSTVLVFLALVEAVTAAHLVSKKKIEQALRMDRFCRIAFPLGFGLLTLIVFSA